MIGVISAPGQLVQKHADPESSIDLGQLKGMNPMVEPRAMLTTIYRNKTAIMAHVQHRVNILLFLNNFLDTKAKVLCISTTLCCL